MVSLGQKLKMRKTCEKRFYKNIRVILCKKTARKNNKYSRTETNLKIIRLRKGYSQCKGYSLCKMVSLGRKFKNIRLRTTSEIECSKITPDI